jgi:hypothetical protein
MIGIGIGIPFGRRGGGFTGVLDLYPNAAAAYSLRKLRKAYTGAAVRIRRSSDNAESDIGFLANGDFDSAAAVAFCGVGNGFITTWYDQSGNSRNVTETTAANQPQIVSSGVVLLIGSKPAVNFDGTNDQLIRVAAGTGISVTGFSVYRNASLLNNPNVFATGLNTVSTARAFGLNSSTGFQRLFAGANLQFNVSSVANTHYLGYSLFNGANSRIAINGSASIVGNAGTNANPDLAIGAALAASNYFNGRIQEVILYPTNQDANKAAIETLINSYYAIY